MRHFLLAVCTLVMAVSGTHAGHHEGGDAKQAPVIGSVYSDEGTPYPLVAGDTGLQQIWIDYIEAHNERDLEKIAEINAEDWTGYPPDGTAIKATLRTLNGWMPGSKPRITPSGRSSG